MPSVDVAMAQSLRRGFLDTLKNSLSRSVAQDLARRGLLSDADGEVTSVKTAFSSWSNCMSVVWCKWPVIAVIAIGGLIILAVAWCIIRCACCGLSCCCGCFRCLKCCGECCGMCDPPKGRSHKYLDEPYIPPHHGYRTQPPMEAAFAPAARQSVETAQYAQFDVAKKGAEDSLPEMPSWDKSDSRKVMVGEEEVEMDQLKSSSELHEPLMAGAASPQLNPHNPLESPAQHGSMPPAGPVGFVGGNGQPPDPYAPPGQNYNNDPNRQSVGFGLDQPYDTQPPSAAGLHGRQSPGNSYQQMPVDRAETVDMNGYDAYGQSDHSRFPEGAQGRPQGPPRGPSRGPTPGFSQGSARGSAPGGYFQAPPGSPVSPFGPPRGVPRNAPSPGPGYGPGGRMAGERGGYGPRRTPANENFNAMEGRRTPGMDPRMRNSPGPRRTPGPQMPGSPGEAPYGQPPRSPALARDRGYGPAPSYSPRINPARTFSPAPDRQQVSTQSSPYGHQEPHAFKQSPPQSPIVNNSGFDFNSGYSRRQEVGQPTEAYEAPATEAYPGYKPYQPTQGG